MQISREIRVPSDGKELRHCAGAFRGAVGAVGWAQGSIWAVARVLLGVGDR